ncbi:TPA: ABC transporter ATP-binding protein [Pseudomonas aeruginosa]|nr:ABC transporter ATP-binding protein [Pseudomonas aeruginosa]HEP8786134.1 ABC transporter ATP-binding protein [Pseudomonas aeruginosa]
MATKEGKMIKSILSPDILDILKPSLPKLIVGTLGSALSGLFMLAALWCLIQLLGDLSSEWAILACALWLAGGALSSWSSFLCHSAEASFTTRLRRTVAAHLVRIPSSTLARYGDDKLKRLISHDISALHHMVAHLPAELTTFVVVPIASITLLVWAAGPAMLLALIPGALTALYYLVVMPKLSARHGKQRAKAMSGILSAVDDYARGIRVNRIFGAQVGALASYRSAARQFTSGMVDWVSSVATPAAIAIALLQAVSTYAIAYSMSYQRDAVALGAALLFSLAVVTPAMKLGHGLDYVALGKAAANRLAEFLREQFIPSGHESLASPPRSLELNKVSILAHDRELLDDLNYRFLPATLTAITGQSGIGKTTLLKTLAGFACPDRGMVMLDHKNIYELDENTRSRWIRLIPQGTDLLATSVRDNLSLSSSDATDEQLVQALRKSQIDIPLDTETKNLSGGERQRVGLAHVFLTPATVILLDEPTSALDVKTASDLMEEIQTLAVSQNKIVIIVTHDHSLINRVSSHMNLNLANHGSMPK